MASLPIATRSPKPPGRGATRPPNPPARDAPPPSNPALRRRRSLWACELILGFLALAGTAITCLVFLFAGSGSWMFALTEDSGIGFAPDPAYWTMNAEATAVEALTCSALAGTAFLPFTTPGGMRTPLRGPLCDGRPSGLAGARHIALATGSWRPSHRITSRTGPLRRHRRRDCNRAEPAGRAGEPPRGSPRVARAPTCTRLGRQRIIHRLRARTVPPHPQPRCGVRSHGGRLHRLPAWRSSRSQR